MAYALGIESAIGTGLDNNESEHREVREAHCQNQRARGMWPQEHLRGLTLLLLRLTVSSRAV